MFGSGKPLRQFIFSVDLGKLVIWALENYTDTQQPLMLCTDPQDEISIGDLAQIVADAMGVKGIEFEVTKSDGQFKKTASNAKLRSLNPDFAFASLHSAIRLTCDWFNANYSSIRK